MIIVMIIGRGRSVMESDNHEGNTELPLSEPIFGEPGRGHLVKRYSQAVCLMAPNIVRLGLFDF